MKTPEEIKKGLGACKRDGNCDSGNCPYRSLGGGTRCIPGMSSDAFAYIIQLESRLAQAERERDAAVRDLNCNWKCAICKNFTRPVNKCPHYRECGLSYMFWQWRGICPENTKVAQRE